MDTESRTQAFLYGAARWIVTAAVVLSAWLFGSSEPWAFLFISQVVGLGLIVWLCAMAREHRAHVVMPGAVAALALLAGFVAVQSVPVSRGLAERMSPLSARSADAAQKILADLPGENAAEFAARMRPALSVSPPATRRSLFLFVAYAGVFLVMSHSIRSWHHLRHVCTFVVVSGFIMALLALAHKFSGARDIFWFHLPRHGGNVFGPFTNRNHFAAHMNMLSGAAIGLFLSSRRVREVLRWPEWRDRMAWLSSRSASRVVLSGFAVLLMTGAVFASVSRGAILSMAAVLALAGGRAVVRERMGWRSRMGIAGCLILAGCAAVWFSRGEAVSRMRALSGIVANPAEDYRWIITLDTLRLFRASPLVGCGFGGFRHVFSMFQTPSLAFRWLHAHNDWAQLPAEGGIVAAGLFAAALALFLRGVRRGYPRASERSRLMIVGLMIGLGTIALHSAVDYSLHKPANALLLAHLAGLTAAAAGRRRRTVREKRAPERHPAWRRAALVSGMLLVLTAVTVMFLSGLRSLRGELAFARFLHLKRAAEKAERTVQRERTIGNAAYEAELVAIYAQHNPDALAEMTGVLLEWSRDPRLSRELRLGLAVKANRCALQAVAGAPADYLTWLWLARTEMGMGHWDGAERCLERARELVSRRHPIRMFEIPDEEPVPTSRPR